MRRALAALLLLVCFWQAASAADPLGLLADYLVAANGNRHVIHAFNSPLRNNELVVYTPEFGPSTATVDAMVEIVVVGDTVQQVLPVGYTNTPIPEDGYVISARGTAATWLRLNVRSGERVQLLRDQLAAPAVHAAHPVHQIGPYAVRGADQLVVFTPGRETTGTNAWGIEAVVRDGVIVAVGGNDNPIPPDGFVLSGHGTAREWLAANARVGSTVELAGNQVIITYDQRSVAVHAQEYIALARERLARALDEGIPLASGAVMNHLARAAALLYDAEVLQAQGQADEAFRTAALGVRAARDASLAALPASPVGVRGVWYRPVEVTPEHVIATLERLSRAGVNVLFLETFYQGRTVYPSEVAAQHTEFRRWDLLSVWIEEGAKRGIDVHLWLHVFRFDEYPTGQLVRSHPDWLASGPDTDVPEHLRANRASVDPAHPEVRAFVLALIEEMLTRYNPVGIHLDYIRYPKSDLQPSSFAMTDYSRQRFREEYGVDPLDFVDRRWTEEWRAWEAWQEAQVTSFVGEVHALLQRMNPDVVLSAAVIGEITEARSVTRQNWPAWVERGYVTMLLPMLYNPDAEWVGRAVAAARRLTDGQAFISAGIGVYLGYSPELVVEQVRRAEAAGSMGATHFALVHMDGEHFAALTPGLYSRPAVPPYRTAEALRALGAALSESAGQTGGPLRVYGLGRLLAAYGAADGPDLEQLISALKDALGAEDVLQAATPWQRGLLEQALHVAVVGQRRAASSAPSSEAVLESTEPALGDPAGASLS